VLNSLCISSPSVMQQIIFFTSHFHLTQHVSALYGHLQVSDTVETATLHQCELILHMLQSIYYYKINEKLLLTFSRFRKILVKFFASQGSRPLVPNCILLSSICCSSLLFIFVSPLFSSSAICNLSPCFLFVPSSSVWCCLH
jgi:hypothetical protein